MSCFCVKNKVNIFFLICCCEVMYSIYYRCNFYIVGDKYNIVCILVVKVEFVIGCFNF